MAQGFKLVLRPSKPGEKDSEKKFYAVSKTNGTSSMKTLCKLISARSTVSSADVKAVLDNLNFVLDMELQEGRYCTEYFCKYPVLRRLGRIIAPAFLFTSHIYNYKIPKSYNNLQLHLDQQCQRIALHELLPFQIQEPYSWLILFLLLLH